MDIGFLPTHMRYKGDLADEFWTGLGKKYFKICGGRDFLSFVPRSSELRPQVNGCMRRGCPTNFRGIDAVSSLYAGARRVYNLDLEQMKHGTLSVVSFRAAVMRSKP